jgi:hypothetical protein
MLGNKKSNSKKVLLTKSKARPQTTTESGATNFMRRYKSQENYLVASKKFKTAPTTGNLANSGSANANGASSASGAINGNIANSANSGNATCSISNTTPSKENNLSPVFLNGPCNTYFNRSKELGTTANNNNNNNSNSNVITICNSTNLKKTPSAKKKNLSPDSMKIQSKMTAYIHSKPRNSNKLAAVSKIMNDESIQELNTEENSKKITY